MAQKVYELMLEECIDWLNYHGTFDKQEVFGSKRFKWMLQIVGCYRLVGERGSFEEQGLSTRQECKLVFFFCCSSGGGNKEQLPMVLKIPRLTKSTLSVCERPFSLLGFGDILVPGENLYLGRGGWDGGHGGRGLWSQHCLFVKDPTPSWGLVSQVRIYT